MKKFENAEIKVVEFEAEDIVTTSNGGIGGGADVGGGDEEG